MQAIVFEFGRGGCYAGINFVWVAIPRAIAIWIVTGLARISASGIKEEDESLCLVSYISAGFCNESFCVAESFVSIEIKAAMPLLFAIKAFATERLALHKGS